MITVDDKIKTFSKYVYEKELKNSNSMINKAEINNNEMLEKKQREIEEKRVTITDKYNKKIVLETQNIISSAKLDANERVMALKIDLLDGFMQEIKDALTDYTLKKEYHEYMKNLIHSNKVYIKEKAMAIYMIKRDIQPFSKELMNLSNQIKILEMDEGNIGGMIIFSKTSKENIDLTLRRKVEHWKNEIGLRLYEALKK